MQKQTNSIPHQGPAAYMIIPGDYEGTPEIVPTHLWLQLPAGRYPLFLADATRKEADHA